MHLISLDGLLLTPGTPGSMNNAMADISLRGDNQMNNVKHNILINKIKKTNDSCEVSQVL